MDAAEILWQVQGRRKNDMSQKIENMLNLALEATPGERERSGEIGNGI